MTREQVETEMAQYRNIFTVVRLLDAAQVGGEESVNSCCSCYSYWGNPPCRNCISRQVLEDRRQRTKLEYFSPDIVQVSAQYMEVDGAPYVLELLQRMQSVTIGDPEAPEALFTALPGNNPKLHHDPRTNMYNRRYYEEIVRGMKGPIGVALMDLDDFKQVNDTYGHDCGDQLLNGFAERLQSALSTAGTLIRLGGDEFIAILYGVSERCIAGERFRRMLEAIGSEPYHLEGIALNPAVSMGLALYPSEADSLEALMRLADADMYEHKKRRRCRNGTETSPSADGASCGAGV